MVGSECKAGGLSELSYEFFCKIWHLTCQDGLLFGGYLFLSVGVQLEWFVYNL